MSSSQTSSAKKYSKIKRFIKIVDKILLCIFTKKVIILIILILIKCQRCLQNLYLIIIAINKVSKENKFSFYDK